MKKNLIVLVVSLALRLDMYGQGADPCPGALAIEDWDPPVATCGSTGQITFAIYTAVPNQNVSYGFGPMDASCYILPTGWTFVSYSQATVNRPVGQATKFTIRLNPGQFTGGTLQVRTKALCGEPTPRYSAWQTIPISRPASSIARNITSSGDICSTGSLTISPQSGDANFSWNVGNYLTVNSGQNTSSVQVSSTGNGTSNLDVSFKDGCSNTVHAYKSVTVGTPLVMYPNLFLFDSYSNMWQFSHDYQPGASWSYYVASGSATLQQNVGDCYITTSTGASVCVYGSNSCGSGSTYCFDVPAGGGSYMQSVSPNPAKDRLVLQFKSTESLKTLPDYVSLYTENSTEYVKSISIKDVYERKAFEQGDKLNIDVNDLPRGIYYLHVIPNEESKQPTQRIRIVLE
jgi:hypothetical protein